MKLNERLKKLLSILLCLCMLVQNAPLAVFAAEGDNLCEHHPEHTEQCHYVAGEHECHFACTQCAQTPAPAAEDACEHVWSITGTCENCQVPCTHDDADADGWCDLCLLCMGAHSFDPGYWNPSFDDYHYLECDNCPYPYDLENGKQPHADDDEDGACDVCFRVIGPCTCTVLCTPSATDESCALCVSDMTLCAGPEPAGCAHDYTWGVCDLCGEACPEDHDDLEGVCPGCGMMWLYVEPGDLYVADDGRISLYLRDSYKYYYFEATGDGNVYRLLVPADITRFSIDIYSYIDADPYYATIDSIPQGKNGIGLGEIEHEMYESIFTPLWFTYPCSHSFSNQSCTKCGHRCDHSQGTIAYLNKYYHSLVCPCGYTDNWLEHDHDSSTGCCTVCGGMIAEAKVNDVYFHSVGYEFSIALADTTAEAPAQVTILSEVEYPALQGYANVDLNGKTVECLDSSNSHMLNLYSSVPGATIVRYEYDYPALDLYGGTITIGKNITVRSYEADYPFDVYYADCVILDGCTVEEGYKASIYAYGVETMVIRDYTGGTIEFYGGSLDLTQACNPSYTILLQQSTAQETLLYNPQNYRVTANKEAVDGVWPGYTTLTITCAHPSYTDGKCSVCSTECAHSSFDADGSCTVCGMPCPHNYTNGFCGICSSYEPATLVTAENAASLGVSNDYVNFYAISNAGQLYWFADFVNQGGDNLSANALLTADITVNTGVLDTDGTPNEGTFRAWTPIGTKSEQYTGTFDGNGKTVSGLYFHDDSADFVGLLGRCDEATVRNVTVADSYFHGGNSIGAIAGRIADSSITGCRNSGSTVIGESYVGGIAGYASGSITDCHNSGDVFTTDTQIGGITGAGNVDISCCTNSGSISCHGSSQYSGYIGGIIGYQNIGTVFNSSNSGSVTATGQGMGHVGGIAGYGSAKNCLNTGTVSSILPDYTVNGRQRTPSAITGAIVGFSRDTSAGANCYYPEGCATYSRPGESTKVATGCANGSGPIADSESTAQSVTAQRFATGEIAWLLQGQQQTHIWGQTIGTQSYPVLGGAKVYQTGTCAEFTFTNTPGTFEHVFVDHVCVCGAVEEGWYSVSAKDSLANVTAMAVSHTVAQPGDTVTVEVTVTEGFRVREVIVTGADNKTFVCTAVAQNHDASHHIATFSMPQMSVTITDVVIVPQSAGPVLQLQQSGPGTVELPDFDSSSYYPHEDLQITLKPEEGAQVVSVVITSLLPLPDGSETVEIPFTLGDDGVCTIPVPDGEDVLSDMVITVTFCRHEGTPTDNGDGTHSFTCTTCGSKVTETHTSGSVTASGSNATLVCGTEGCTAVLATAALVMAQTEKVYDGNPFGGITVETTGLWEDLEFSFLCYDSASNPAEPVDAGHYECEAHNQQTGICLRGSFDILPANLNDATARTNSAVYTGSPVEPAVTVMMNRRTLQENKDYTLEYLWNTDAGTGYLIATGIGNYTGNYATTFTIRKAEIDSLPTQADVYVRKAYSYRLDMRQCLPQPGFGSYGNVRYTLKGHDISSDCLTGEITLNSHWLDIPMAWLDAAPGTIGSITVGVTTSNFTVSDIVIPVILTAKLPADQDIQLDVPGITYGQLPAPSYSYTGTAEGTPTWTITYRSCGDFVELDALLVDGLLPAGPYTVRATYEDGTHYGYAQAILTVSKADPAYTLPTGITATYGDTLSDVALPAGWAWTEATAPVGNVGQHGYSACFTPEDSANYNLVNETVFVQVQPKPILGAEVTFRPMTYTGAAQIPVATVTLDGETVTGTWSSVRCVGETSIFTASGNFSGTLNEDPGMARAIPTVPALEQEDPSDVLHYGQPLSELPLANGWQWVSPDLCPTANADQEAVRYVDDRNYDYTDVDGYDPATHSVTGTIYVGIESATPVITIQGVPAGAIIGETVTVTASSANPNHSGLTDLPSVTLTYRIGDGEAQPFTGSFTIPYDVPNGTVITVTAASEGSRLYTAATATATITVTAYSVSHTARDMEVTYSGAAVDLADLFTLDPHAGAATYSVTGGTGAGTLSGSMLTVTKAGSFTVKVTTAPNGAYAPGQATATLMVTKAAGNGTVTITGWTYGDEANAPEATGTGSVTYRYSTTDGQAPTNAGTYTVTATFAENDLYTAGTATAAFTVAPKAVTVTANAQSKVYGEADPAFPYTAEGLVGSDTFTGTLSRAEGENVGTYAITQGSLTAGGNYTITYAGADLTISPKPITVTANAQSRIYGEADPALTYSSEGLVGSDTFTGTLSRAAGEDVGTYAITQGSLTAGSNYTITYVGADLTVNPKPVTAADVQLSGSLTYNGQSQTQSITVTAGYTYSVSGNTQTDAGSYTLTVKGLGNYTGQVDVPWTIAPRAIADAAITLGQALTYTGSQQTQSIVSVTVDGLTVTYAVTGDSQTDAGSYTLTVTGSGNFTGSATAGWSIAKADPAIGTVSCPGTQPDTLMGGDVVLSRTGTAVPGTLTLTDSKLDVAVTTYHWSFTPDDTRNYETVTGTVEITVDHLDENRDHTCDGCAATVGDHTDAEGDGDHLCDYGCGGTIGECFDTDTDQDHLCDECAAPVPKEGTQVTFPADDTGTLTPNAPAEIDGVPIRVDWDGEIWLTGSGSKLLTTYTYAQGDNGTTYPTAMYVWLLTWDEEGCTAQRIYELDNFLLYQGTSIRIGGSSDGIRFFTSTPAAAQDALIAGTLLTGDLEGYRLVEMGTLYKWAHSGAQLTTDNGASSFVYGGDAGTSFRIFSKEGEDNWFTGMLVGLNGDAKTLSDQIISRPYAVLERENADGTTETITLYGGSISRSIYQVALQNRDYWEAGTAYDDYVENIIATVEGANP